MSIEINIIINNLNSPLEILDTDIAQQISLEMAKEVTCRWIIQATPFAEHRRNDLMLDIEGDRRYPEVDRFWP